MAGSALRFPCMGVAFVLAGLAIWGFARELPDFWDPCLEWGDGGDGGSLSLAPGEGECAEGRRATSETKVGAAVRMALVWGTTVVASVLAGIGAWRTASTPMLVAAGLMGLESLVLFFGLSIAFPLALAAAILYLVAGLRWRRSRPVPAPATVSDGL